MNRCNRTSRLLDLARRVPSEIIDGSGDAVEIRRTWKKLGGVKLLRGRRVGISAADLDYPQRRERKHRDRSPERTHAQRRAQRKGWQD